MVCYKNKRSKEIEGLARKGLSQGIALMSRGMLTNFQKSDLDSPSLFLPVDSFLKDVISGLRNDRRNVKTVLELLSEEGCEVGEILDSRESGFCNKYSLDDSAEPAQKIARGIIRNGLIEEKTLYSPVFYGGGKLIPFENKALVKEAEKHDLAEIGRRLF